MSIIAYKIEKKRIRVACDGRVISGDEIVTEDKVKIMEVSKKKIICGGTGLNDSIDVWKGFIARNADRVLELKDTESVLALAVDFKNTLLDEYHYSDEMFAEMGGFFFITPTYHCIIYYDEGRGPYLAQNEDEKYGCFGSTRVYTKALLDTGIDIVDAIKMSTKKFTTINDHVFELSFKI
jgi:hypothetical protein